MSFLCCQKYMYNLGPNQRMVKKYKGGRFCKPTWYILKWYQPEGTVENIEQITKSEKKIIADNERETTGVKKWDLPHSWHIKKH